MSANHITEEEFKDQSRDGFWKDHYTAQGKVLKINEEIVKQAASSGLIIKEAEMHAVSIFNQEFSDELDHLPQWKQNCLVGRAQVVEERDKLRQAVDDLRSRGRDKEATGKRFDIPRHEKVLMVIFEIAAWGFYLAGLAATAIFLHDQAGFEWWKAILFPIAGVSALVFGLKAVLNSLAGHQSKLAPVAKYATGILGLACAVGWLVYYAEFAGTIAAGPQFESLDGTSATPDQNRGPIIMIVLGALAEGLIAAFLFQVVYDIRQRHMFHDKVVETQEFIKAKNDLEACELKLAYIDSRKTHADAIVTILLSVKERLIADAQLAYKIAETKRT